MPTDGEAAQNRKPDVSPKQICRQETRQSSFRQELTRKESGEGRDVKVVQQPTENSGLKSSGLFGFVQYFMERPDSSAPGSGASTPLPGPETTAPIEVPSPCSPTGNSLQLTSNSPGSSPDPELVKKEVFSDGNKSDKSDAVRNEPVPELLPSQSSRLFLKSEEYRQLFHLPPEEILVEDFNCALQKKILLQGHMYLFERYVCFYSNIFGYEKKKVVPLKDITCVRKAKTAGVFPNAIEITSWGKKHFFASFLSRDEAYRLIINGWSQHSGYARIFLGSNHSPLSSPPSQGRISLDSAILSSSWRSPRRAVTLNPEEVYTPRNLEEMPSLAPPPSAAEVTDMKSVERQADLTDADNSLEGPPDERLSTNESSSVSTTSVSPLWECEDADAPELPEGYKMISESEFPIDVEEFFQLFFSDDSVGFNKHFHSVCGDDDFRCTQWAKHRHFGHARDISFRHPIKFYFGPKSTYCHESQRFRIYRNSHLVLETSQQMTDIPYGDYFRVEVRWDVERLCENGNCHCLVRISLGVTFSKKTVWRGKIEQGTHEESKEAYSTWIQEARTTLGEVRALAAEAGNAENQRPGAHSGSEEAIRALAGNEAEQPDRRIQDQELTVKTTHNGVEDSVTSGHKASLHRRRWTTKGSAMLGTISQGYQNLWEKGSNVDFKANKHLKLVCFILMVIMIVLMQVGILVALTRVPQVQYVPAGYPNTEPTSGACFGGSKGDEALAWLEQRARHVREEIVLAEGRLQTLHQDLAVLKSHANHLLSFINKEAVNPQHISTEGLHPIQFSSIDVHT